MVSCHFMPPNHAFAADLRASVCPLDEFRMAKLPCQTCFFCINLKTYYADVCVKEHWFPMLPKCFYSNQTMSILANYWFPLTYPGLILKEILPDLNSDTLGLVIEGLGHQTKPPSQSMVNSVLYEPIWNARIREMWTKSHLIFFTVSRYWADPTHMKVNYGKLAINEALRHISSYVVSYWASDPSWFSILHHHRAVVFIGGSSMCNGTRHTKCLPEEQNNQRVLEFQV